MISYIYEMHWGIYTRGSCMFHFTTEFIEGMILREFFQQWRSNIKTNAQFSLWLIIIIIIVPCALSM